MPRYAIDYVSRQPKLSYRTVEPFNLTEDRDFQINAQVCAYMKDDL